jgi:hypothetical protein
MCRRVLCLLLLSVPLSAADQQPGRLAFSATLESIKINGRPDEVVTRQFRLTLHPDQPRTRFHASVEDFWRSEDGAQSFYAAPGTLRRSCGRWVSVNPVDTAVEPGGTLVVRVSVAIPHEVPNGGFWCALTVDEVPDPEAASSGVGVKFLASVSTGIFVYLGDVQRAASIVDLDVTPDRAQVRVRNEGNAPLGVEGRIEFLTPGADRALATVTLPRNTLLTEPSVEGVFAAALPAQADLPDGPYLMRAVLDYGADHYIGAEREVVVSRTPGRGGPSGPPAGPAAREQRR